MSRLRTQSNTLYVSSRPESYTALTHRNRESSVWSGISLDSFCNPLNDSVQNCKGDRIFDVVVVSRPIQLGEHRLVFPEFHLEALGTLNRTETLPQRYVVSAARVEEHLATVRASYTGRSSIIDAVTYLSHHDLHSTTTSRAIQQTMNTLSQVGSSSQICSISISSR